MSTLPRFDRLPQEKQQRILDVASEEFIAHGFDQASLNRIIERSEISKGSMYYYFHDKTHLYVAVVDRLVMDVLEEHLLPDLSTLNAENFWERFAEHMDHVAAHWQKHPRIFALAKTLQPLRRRRDQEPFAKLFDRNRLWLRQIFEAGQNLGVLRDDLPLDLMMTLWMSVDECLDSYGLDLWDDMDADERREFIARGWDFFRRMFERRSQ
ncbi:MAG: TetR/AcrR family transcriptional regulator [Myxococcota bacterium]